ncbi:MAG: PfkB family carbohydrate kinase [Candidatus Woesearchaeota archaeon]
MKRKSKRELILETIGNFKNKRVLVIGDSILDEFVYGEKIGTSLETPTPKLKHEKTDILFGGAANVVESILELGGKVSFVTVLGDDSYAKNYDGFVHKNLNFFPIKENGRKTTVKRRFWAGNEKLLQIDHLDNRDISDNSKREIIGILLREIKNSDIVLFVDQRHGMMTSDLIAKLKLLVVENGKGAIASSQISQRASNHLDYCGSYLVCMNHKEAQAVDSEFSKKCGLGNLAKKLDSNICVTLGKEGALMYLNGKEHFAEGIEVEQKEDACGAGDCFLAALSLINFEKFPQEALYLSNCWAGLSVTTPGTRSPKITDLVEYVKKNG